MNPRITKVVVLTLLALTLGWLTYSYCSPSRVATLKGYIAEGRSIPPEDGDRGLRFVERVHAYLQASQEPTQEQSAQQLAPILTELRAPHGPAWNESVTKAVDMACGYLDRAYETQEKAWYEILGAICFGGVIGWTAHYVVHRTANIGIGSIASFTAAVGGGGVLRAFGSQFPFLAVYCTGLATAYFARAFFTQTPILNRIIGSSAGNGSETDGMNEDAWDLLATLWKFQKQCFGADAKSRWQLAISPLSADFADFASGFARAKKLSYVDILPDRHLINLSTSGYQFCQQNEKKLNRRKRLFFVEQGEAEKRK